MMKGDFILEQIYIYVFLLWLLFELVNLFLTTSRKAQTSLVDVRPIKRIFKEVEYKYTFQHKYKDQTFDLQCYSPFRFEKNRDYIISESLGFDLKKKHTIIGKRYLLIRGIILSISMVLTIYYLQSKNYSHTYLLFFLFIAFYFFMDIPKKDKEKPMMKGSKITKASILDQILTDSESERYIVKITFNNMITFGYRGLKSKVPSTVLIKYFEEYPDYFMILEENNENKFK